MIENMWTIIGGKFVLGFAIGFTLNTSGRVLEEFTPID
jgi:hypothetical protein